jgi:hypothetical protein
MFSANNLPRLPYKENGWDIFVTQKLKDLNLLNHDKIWVERKKILPEIMDIKNIFAPSFFQPQNRENNPFVPWDGFKIQKTDSSINKEKLYTENLSSCYALCAQIYDMDGQLSHIALAHCFSNPDLPDQFFKKIIETTSDKHSYINLFICGGNNSSKNMYYAVMKAISNMGDLKLVHNISMQLNKNVMMSHENKLYSGSIGIAEAGFDDNFHPRISVDVEINGLKLENLSHDKQMECKFY